MMFLKCGTITQCGAQSNPLLVFQVIYTVYLCYHNIIPWTERLKQFWKFISHNFGNWEVQGQGTRQFGFWWELFPWLVLSCLLAISLHSNIWHRDGEWESKRANSLESVLIRTLILSYQGPILMTWFDLNEFLKDPSSNVAILEARTYMNFMRTQT